MADTSKTTETTMTINENNGVQNGPIKSYKDKGFTYKIDGVFAYPLESKTGSPSSVRSDHFVRFYINLDQESHFLTEGKVNSVGVVDQTDQSRLRSKPMNQQTFNQAATTAAVAKAAATDVGGVIGKTLGGLTGFKGNAIRGIATVATKALLAAGGGAIAYELAKNIKVDKVLKRLATTITLYTPPTITNALNTDWQNYNDPMFELLQLLGDATPGDIMKNSGGIAAAVGRTIATASSELVQSATRTVVNPKKDLLFKSIARREFTFDYQFAPKSKDESDEVANIIQIFRMFAAPEVVANTDQFLYTYPAEFDIEYGFIDSTGKVNQNKYLNKISSCVLKSVQVNYSPNGTFQTLENGDPIQINMTLHFEEIETLHRDRIAAGY
ncbi:MAG TPA: baseplate tail-tube junction protein [Methanosarcina sp.]|nr:baseplate tail-tube junction protein [Methanosarcina sp.]